MRPALLLPLVFALAGCGESAPKLAPVTGTLTVAGKPVVGGSLTFHPTSGAQEKGDKPSCQLKAGGAFEAQTYPYGPGVPPGPYKVTLSADLANRIKRPDLADPAKTPLAVDVPAAGLTDHALSAK